MKWQNAKKILEQDPWLKYVLLAGHIRRGNEANEKGLLESVVDCNVTHIMFRGAAEHYRIDSRPVERMMSISSNTTITSDVAGKNFDDFKDHLGYGIGYYLVVEAQNPQQVIVDHLTWTPHEYGAPPRTKSIRWSVIEQSRKLRHREHQWIALVRNVSIISQGEYLMNGYDVYKFQPEFNPYRACWHFRAKEVSVLTTV